MWCGLADRVDQHDGERDAIVLRTGIAVSLLSFQNIDLFAQGFYAVRVNLLDWSEEWCAATLHSRADDGTSSCSVAPKSRGLLDPKTGTYTSPTIEIMYIEQLENIQEIVHYQVIQPWKEAMARQVWQVQIQLLHSAKDAAALAVCATETVAMAAPLSFSAQYCPVAFPMAFSSVVCCCIAASPLGLEIHSDADTPAPRPVLPSTAAVKGFLPQDGRVQGQESDRGDGRGDSAGDLAPDSAWFQLSLEERAAAAAAAKAAEHSTTASLGQRTRQTLTTKLLHSIAASSTTSRAANAPVKPPPGDGTHGGTLQRRATASWLHARSNAATLSGGVPSFRLDAHRSAPFGRASSSAAFASWSDARQPPAVGADDSVTGSLSLGSAEPTGSLTPASFAARAEGGETAREAMRNDCKPAMASSAAPPGAEISSGSGHDGGLAVEPAAPLPRLHVRTPSNSAPAAVHSDKGDSCSGNFPAPPSPLHYGSASPTAALPAAFERQVSLGGTVIAGGHTLSGSWLLRPRPDMGTGTMSDGGTLGQSWIGGTGLDSASTVELTDIGTYDGTFTQSAATQLALHDTMSLTPPNAGSQDEEHAAIDAHRVKAPPARLQDTLEAVSPSFHYAVAEEQLSAMLDGSEMSCRMAPSLSLPLRLSIDGVTHEARAPGASCGGVINNELMHVDLSTREDASGRSLPDNSARSCATEDGSSRILAETYPPRSPRWLPGLKLNGWRSEKAGSAQTKERHTKAAMAAAAKRSLAAVKESAPELKPHVERHAAVEAVLTDAVHSVRRWHAQRTLCALAVLRLPDRILHDVRPTITDLQTALEFLLGQAPSPTVDAVQPRQRRVQFTASTKPGTMRREAKPGLPGMGTPEEQQALAAFLAESALAKIGELLAPLAAILHDNWMGFLCHAIHDLPVLTDLLQCEYENTGRLLQAQLWCVHVGCGEQPALRASAPREPHSEALLRSWLQDGPFKRRAWQPGCLEAPGAGDSDRAKLYAAKADKGKQQSTRSAGREPSDDQEVEFPGRDAAAVTRGGLAWAAAHHRRWLGKRAPGEAFRSFNQSMWQQPERLPVLVMDWALAPRWFAALEGNIGRAAAAQPEALRVEGLDPRSVHLFVFVHGFGGLSTDLRIVQNHVLQTVANSDSLMCQSMEGLTTSGIDLMAAAAAKEVLEDITQREAAGVKVAKLSFVGHSAGNLTIRQLLRLPELQPYLGRLQTYISLSGPHLGINPAPALMVAGISILDAFGKGATLRQLSLTDHRDPRQSLLYEMSEQSQALGHFRHIVLMSSEEDGYIPLASARISPSLARLHKSAHAKLQAAMADNVMAGIRRGAAERDSGGPAAAAQGDRRHGLSEADGWGEPDILRVEVAFAPGKKPLGSSVVPLLKHRVAHVSFLEVEELSYIFSHAALAHMTTA